MRRLWNERSYLAVKSSLSCLFSFAEIAMATADSPRAGGKKTAPHHPPKSNLVNPQNVKKILIWRRCGWERWMEQRAMNKRWEKREMCVVILSQRWFHLYRCRLPDLRCLVLSSCVLQKKLSRAGLARHEGERMIKRLGWTVTLKIHACLSHLHRLGVFKHSF